ncbi:hypothetical protein GWK47_045914 [Chionoecetes opilio]|uniref:Uncharacterized protein n=1 Tax=Chionoecetes opilio TaxID=41210 RepID=A0A8J5CHA5_CHIOP|nr:hypothetical protein GWK47_045914 [Chionoecetes opilio]
MDDPGAPMQARGLGGEQGGSPPRQRPGRYKPGEVSSPYLRSYGHCPVYPPVQGDKAQPGDFSLSSSVLPSITPAHHQPLIAITLTSPGGSDLHAHRIPRIARPHPHAEADVMVVTLMSPGTTATEGTNSTRLSNKMGKELDS